MEMPKRTCPECGGANYTFRSRKQIEATAEKPAGYRQPIQTHIGEQSGPTSVQKLISSSRNIRPSFWP